MKLFLGAEIYKELSRGIIHEIYCVDDPVDQKVRAFKKRIKVDMSKLLSIIR